MHLGYNNLLVKNSTLSRFEIWQSVCLGISTTHTNWIISVAIAPLDSLLEGSTMGHSTLCKCRTKQLKGELG